ncbi:MAG TPA: PHP domain-containing protein [Syntrophales bacterium]|nr:PHP domain-containing protein [Syntrophales bacterium]HOM06918.1 PHP domain-containing protein [Syntrophales bacterium]HON98780.1 PHP domain-containing protein [Syntrophales bacterium]HPC00960.1 PHP domain-containing protein [Syntrophales bacterium]HPQ06459.1 PHP domain-containing protein [Syntrophales bacterium]
MKLKPFRCDLHIHTCLSPCGDLDMTPRAIVARAREVGLDMIAVCDHNASENVRYVQQAAEGKGIVVLPGMEVSSREEVHLLAIFDNLESLEAFQEVVYRCLPGLNDERYFGCQPIVNEFDEVEGINERLLIGATGLSLEEVLTAVHSRGGLLVPSHVERQSFGIIGQLGFIDPALPFDALEITSGSVSSFREKHPELAPFVFLRSSDAHFLTQIGRSFTRAWLAEASFAELRLALHRLEGRYVEE